MSDPREAGPGIVLPSPDGRDHYWLVRQPDWSRLWSRTEPPARAGLDENGLPVNKMRDVPTGDA